MYFDAVVVEFKTFFYFDSNWLWPFCGKFQFKNEVNLWDHPFIKIKGFSEYWLSHKNLKLSMLTLEYPSLNIIPGLVSCMNKLEEREKKK